MNILTIKKATYTEARIVAELVVELLSDFNQVNNSKFSININELVNTAGALLTRSTYAAYIAYADQLPVGVITISLGSAIYNLGDFGVITELYTKPDFRSKKIGEQLLSEAIHFAKEKNWRKIEVGAPNTQEWPRTIVFYKKNNFKEKGPKLRLDL